LSNRVEILDSSRRENGDFNGDFRFALRQLVDEENGAKQPPKSKRGDGKKRFSLIYLHLIEKILRYSDSA
jgi:hypothetical protein